MRVVLDTNCLVSALIFGHGRLVWLRRAWHSATLVPLLSEPTAAELVRVLGYPKFRLSPEDRHALLADLLPFTETVTITAPPPPTPPSRDPADQIFLETALAGRADALVTGDADLLALSSCFSIPIITPAALGARLGTPK